MTVQKNTKYTPFLVAALAAFLVVSSFIFLVSRALLPGDNSQILLEEMSAAETGLTVETVDPEGSLQEGDTITAINDRQLADWLSGHLNRQTDSPTLEDGQFLSYAILREGNEITIPVRLESFSLGQAFLQRWSLYFFLLYLLVVSIVVFVKRPRTPAAQMFLLVSAAIFASGLIFFLGLQISDLLRPEQIALWIWGSIILYGLLTASLLHFTFVFPQPSMNPKYRNWLLIAIYLGVWVPYLLFALPLSGGAQNPVELLLLLARSTAIMTLTYFSLILIASFFKYRRTDSLVERRQMRWILWALIIANVPWLILSAVPAVLGESSQIASNVTGLLWLLIPTAFAISILREGLFDIDVIIRRTLIFTILTVMLAAIYFGSVIVLQSLFTAVSGQQSAVAIVISTLVIAALFQPLRQRIQGWIDRRFFRRKYDASQTLSKFASKARDEINLEQLSEELLHVVAETMQPDRVWLWLKTDSVAQKNQAHKIGIAGRRQTTADTKMVKGRT